jgi:hypothetical protein
LREEKDGAAVSEDQDVSILERIQKGEQMDGNQIGDQFAEAADVPSFYLRGVIPGKQTSEGSDDPNFDPISDGSAPADVMPSDAERVQIQDASLRRHQKDPHYQAVLDGFGSFIIGKGFQVSADDENPEVQDFLDEFMRVNRFNGRDRQIIMKVLKGGEMFVRFSFKGAQGESAKMPVVRCLNYWEITRINYDPKDAETAISYVRTYKGEKGQKAEEIIPAAEIVHFKFADYETTRGLPPFGGIMAWCQYYVDWLFNRVVLNRLKTSFYLEKVVDGTPSAVAATAAQDTVQNRKTKTGKDILRMPKPGTVLTHNTAVTYKWLKPEVGADDAKEDGRAIRLAICAGAQAPEFLLGDASNANFSSTIVSQNPFVRRVEFFQDFFGAFFEEVFRRVLSHAVAGKFLMAKSTETVAVEKAQDVGLLRRFIGRIRARFAPSFQKIQERAVGTIFKETVNAAGDAVVSKVVDTKLTVTIQWPTLIAQDILKDTQALQIQKAMGAISLQTARERLGYDDAEEERRIKSEDERSGGNQDAGDELGGAARDQQIELLNPDGTPKTPEEVAAEKAKAKAKADAAAAAGTGAGAE